MNRMQDGVVQQFLAQQNSPKTITTYERGIRSLATHQWGPHVVPHTVLPWSVIDVASLIVWKNTLANSKTAASSQVSAWQGAKSFFHFLMGAGYITLNPFNAVKGPAMVSNRSPRIPSDQIVQTILNATSGYSQRDFAIAWLLLSGLRVAEVAALNLDSMTFVSHYNAVVLRVLGKGKHERLVPLGALALAALSDWIAVRERQLRHAPQRTGTEPLFTGNFSRNMRMTIRQVQEVIIRAARTGGLPVRTVSAHSLRHHYATRLIRAKATPFAVQKLLGHKSIKTTQVYVNLDLTDMIEATGLDPLDARNI